MLFLNSSAGVMPKSKFNLKLTLIKAETKAANATNESRPATARTALATYNSNAKADQANERKIKLLNKTLKSFHVDISNLQKENSHIKKVSFLDDILIIML